MMYKSTKLDRFFGQKIFNPETGGLLIRAEVFDILFINGHNVQGETLEERLYRHQLSEILWKS